MAAAKVPTLQLGIFGYGLIAGVYAEALQQVTGAAAGRRAPSAVRA